MLMESISVWKRHLSRMHDPRARHRLPKPYRGSSRTLRPMWLQRSCLHRLQHSGKCLGYHSRSNLPSPCNGVSTTTGIMAACSATASAKTNRSWISSLQRGTYRQKLKKNKLRSVSRLACCPAPMFPDRRVITALTARRKKRAGITAGSRAINLERGGVRLSIMRRWIAVIPVLVVGIR